LGIGAAVSASPIAWADDDSSSSTSSTGPQAHSSSTPDTGGTAAEGTASQPTGTSSTPTHQAPSTPSSTRAHPQTDTDTSTGTGTDGDADSRAHQHQHTGDTEVTAPSEEQPSSPGASTPAEVITAPATEPEPSEPGSATSAAHGVTSTGSDHHQPDADVRPHAVDATSAQPAAVTQVKATPTPKVAANVTKSDAPTLGPASTAPVTAAMVATTALDMTPAAVPAGVPSLPQTLVALARRVIDTLLAPFATPLPIRPDSSPILLAIEWFRRTTVGAFYNRAPGAAPLQIGEDANGQVIGTIGATDPDGDPLTYQIIQGPTQGSVAVHADGTYTYTPNAALALDGGSDTFTVNVGDGGLRLFSQTSTTPVSVTVQVGAADALAINGTPFAVAMSPDGKHAYITDVANDRVSVLDVATRAVVGSILVGGAPSGIAIAADGRAYVVNSADGTVTVFDTATNNVVRPYVYVGSDPTGIAVNAAGTRVVVANSYEDSVSVIDTATWNVTRVVVGDGPYGVAISGDRALITNEFDDTVTVLDLTTNTVAATISVGDAPTGIAAVGNRAVVTNTGTTTTPGDGTVSIIDLDTLTVVGSPIVAGDSPMSVVIDATGTYAYIADEDRSVVSVLDVAAATMTDQTRAVAAGPTGLALGADGVLYVAGYMAGTVDPLEVKASPTTVDATTVLASAITTNPTAAAAASSTAPTQEWSTSTKGFDIYNDTFDGWVISYDGDYRPNGGGPAVGTVLAPGAHLHLEIPVGYFSPKTVTMILTRPTGESWHLTMTGLTFLGVNDGQFSSTHFDAHGNPLADGVPAFDLLKGILPERTYLGNPVPPIRIADTVPTSRTVTVSDPDVANLVAACTDGSSVKCSFQPDGAPTVTWTEWQQAMEKQGPVAYEYNDRDRNHQTRFEIGYTAIAHVVDDVGVKGGLSLVKPTIQTLSDASGRVIPNVRTFLPPALRYDLPPKSSVRVEVRAPLLVYTGSIAITAGKSTVTITGVVYEVPDNQRDVELRGEPKPGG
jgi:YVTN family beta-propeller protein